MTKLFPQHDAAIQEAALDYLRGQLHTDDHHEFFAHRFSHLSGLEQRLVITRCKMLYSRIIVAAIRAEMEVADAAT